MKTTTIIIRDTDYSFIKKVTKEGGEIFERKLEKGTPEYSNACLLFNMKNVALVKGNQVAE